MAAAQTMEASNQEKQKQLQQLITERATTQTLQTSNGPAVVVYYTAKLLWELLLLNKTAQWTEFKKRCAKKSNEHLVYIQDGLPFLNVHYGLTRGMKRWLVTKGVLDERKFLTILEYFQPIAHSPNLEVNPFITTGIPIETICRTLVMPSFFPNKSVEDTELFFKGRRPGAHIFRLSHSTPFTFTLDYLTDNNLIKSIRIERIAPEGLQLIFFGFSQLNVWLCRNHTRNWIFRQKHSIKNPILIRSRTNSVHRCTIAKIVGH